MMAPACALRPWSDFRADPDVDVAAFPSRCAAEGGTSTLLTRARAFPNPILGQGSRSSSWSDNGSLDTGGL